MKTKIQMTGIIAFLLVAVAAISAGASGRFGGEFVSWSIEEQSGWGWTELSAGAGNRSSTARTDNNSHYGGYSTSYSSFSIKPTLGKKYRIKVSNLTQCRMAVTVEVDGKNSINSTNVTGTADDAAWVLNGNSTINVSGFQASSKTAMEFYWTTRDDAHSDQRAELGDINMYVYFENGWCARNTLDQSNNSPQTGRSLAKQQPGATGAGDEIYNPVHTVNFDSLTRYPLEKITVNYDRQKTPPVWRDDRDREDNGRGDDYSRDKNNDSRSWSSNCFTGIGIEGTSTGYTGVYITNVFRGKPAWNAGVRAGDKIVKIGGKNVNDISEMTNILRRMSPGDYVVIKYVHNGKARSAGVSVDTICP